MLQQIEFTRGGSNTIIGNFEPGMIVRCGDALARHFIGLGLARSLEAERPQPEHKARKAARGRKSA